MTTGKRRTELVTLRMWTDVGAMGELSLSTMSTIQLSRSAMTKSEPMRIGETSRSDVNVSKHPDLEVKERCESGDLLAVTVGTGGLSSSASCAGFSGFSGFSLRLKANFGLVPVEV